MRTNLSQNFFGLLKISATTYLDVTSSAVQVRKGWFSIRMFSSLLNIGHDVTIISCRKIVTKVKSVNIILEQRMLSPVNSNISKSSENGKGHCNLRLFVCHKRVFRELTIYRQYRHICHLCVSA